MIILFEEDEKLFTTLGLGILKDSVSCSISETLNDQYELEMNYPLNGINFSKIKVNRIIYCKPNPYSEAQPFRIYSISKPLNGVVTVNAAHISYDMNGIIIKSLEKGTLRTVLEEIQNGCLTPSPFNFYTDVISDKTYELTSPSNMRGFLMGNSGSLLEQYKFEILFDKFDVHLLTKRGENRGVEIRYAKNLTDISSQSSYDNLYNGVYPYYHTESTTTETNTTTNEFKKVYIVGSKPFQDGWLSYTSGGDPYHPVDEAPVQIASDGNYKDKVYCWNTVTQRYVEKVYNQTITLVEGVTSPDWISIDWSTFPKIVCKAEKEGYFKTASDTTWGDKKKVGDIIFQGSIASSETLSNIILYFAEVIPPSTTSSTEETTSVTHVELTDKIIWLNTDEAKAMRYNRILALDLTSEFEEAPTEDKLKAKANEYIEKNKIGKEKVTTDVSFIDISSTDELSKIKDFEKIELGDTVKVVYDALGISLDLRVMTTKYNAITDKYTEIKLGDKEETISANSVQSGDGVSSLTNDEGYADVTTVNKLIAKMVTAEYIEAKNAKLTQAQIDDLTTARISCSGIIEASQFQIDKLVAKMLVADNAEIANVLKAGSIQVAGDISITSGNITIENKTTETVFKVDRSGNVTANSVKITGGELNIGEGNFVVNNDGSMSALEATIAGKITSSEGNIAGFTIDKESIHNGDIGKDLSVYVSTGTSLSAKIASSANIKGWAFTAGTKFGVTSSGIIYASGAILDSAKVTGEIIASKGTIGGFTISENAIYKDISSFSTSNKDGVYLGNDGIRLGKYFTVSNTGELYSSEANISGTINAKDGKIGGFTISENSLYSGTINSMDDIVTYISLFGHVDNSSSTGSKEIIEDYYYSGIKNINCRDYYSWVSKTNVGVTILTTERNPKVGEKIAGRQYVDESGNLVWYDEDLNEIVDNSLSIIGFTLNGSTNDIIEEYYYSGFVEVSGSYYYSWVSKTNVGVTLLTDSKNVSVGDVIDKRQYVDDNADVIWYSSCTKKVISLIHSNNKSVYISPNGIRLGDWLFAYNNGKLVCYDAEITGKIIARSGYIGDNETGKGFLISDNSIQNGLTGLNNPSEINSEGIYLSSEGIRLGVESDLKVDEDYMTANDLGISGEIAIVPYQESNYIINLKMLYKGKNGILKVIDADFEELLSITVDDKIYIGSEAYKSLSFEFTNKIDKTTKLDYSKNYIDSPITIKSTDTVSESLPRTNQIYSMSVYGNNNSGTLKIVDGNDISIFEVKRTFGTSEYKFYFKTITNSTVKITYTPDVENDYILVKSIYAIPNQNYLTVCYSVATAASNCKLTLKPRNGFLVKKDGSLFVSNACLYYAKMMYADVTGKITATSGYIGGMNIDDNSIRYNNLGEDNSVVMSTGTVTEASIAGSESMSGWVFTAGKKFGVTKEGVLYASTVNLTGTITTASQDGIMRPSPDVAYQYSKYSTSTLFGGIVTDSKRYSSSDFSDASYLDESKVYINPTGAYLSPVTNYNKLDKDLYPRAMFFGVELLDKDALSYAKFYPGLMNSGLYVRTYMDESDTGTSKTNSTYLIAGGKLVFGVESKYDGDNGSNPATPATATFQVSELTISTVFGNKDVFHLERSIIAGDISLTNSIDMTPTSESAAQTTTSQLGYNYCAVKEPIYIKSGITTNKISQDQWINVATLPILTYDVINVTATLSQDSKDASGYGGALVYLERTSSNTIVWLANDGGNPAKYIRYNIIYRHHYYY